MHPANDQRGVTAIDARRQLVEGAVGMVNEALKRLSKQQIIELDEERQASMLNNLLVVLTLDQSAQPVVNTGSLYSCEPEEKVLTAIKSQAL